MKRLITILLVLCSLITTGQSIFDHAGKIRMRYKNPSANDTLTMYFTGDSVYYYSATNPFAKFKGGVIVDSIKLNGTWATSFGSIYGSGTANKIPYFAASNTLANSPLTVSTNDVNCAGKVEGSNIETNGTSFTTRLGLLSGANENETTYRANTLLGWNAANDLTTGYDNVVIGYNSGEKITDSYSNTLVGSESGNSVTSGFENTLIGYGSGGTLSSGDRNTAIGKQAGGGNGNNSIFIGYKAGTNSNASNRLVIGSIGQGSAADDSTKNIIWGYQHATTANQRLTVNGRFDAHNVETNATSYTTRLGIGTSNSENETAERWNTFIGSYSGYTTSTGGYNTFVGTNSGYSNSTGLNNICIGNAAGKNNSTLSNRLFIGSIDQNNLAQDSTESIIYGYQHGTVANQKLYVNAKAVVTNDLTYELRHGFYDKSDNYTPAVTQNVYTKISPTFTSSESSNITFAGDSITIVTAGDYFLTYSVTFNGANGDDFTIQLRKNNSSVKSIRQTTSGASNYHSCTLIWYFDGLAVGDDISLWITNTANNNDPTLSSQDIYIRKEHD